MIPHLVDFLIILTVSIPVTFLFHRLRLPVIVGFLATGVIVGPHAAGLIADVEAVKALAEIGVVLLLFTIGIEMSVAEILSSGKKNLIVGAAQIVLTIAVTAVLSIFFSLPIQQGIFMGFLFSLSSTAIVLKILADRAEVDTPYGKASVAILLIQDVSIIPMMLLTPNLTGDKPEVGLILGKLGMAIVAVVGLYIVAKYVVPHLLKLVVQIRNRDVFLVTILFICLGTAFASSRVGLSLAIGAFIAGLVISESHYSHQILAEILPFRNTFNAIFFISVGMLLNVPYMMENPVLNLGIAALVLVGKGVLVFAILRFAGSGFRVSWLSAFALCQVGEFSFLLAEQGHTIHVIPDSLYQIFLASSVLTMFCTPFLFLLAHPLGMKVQEWLTGESHWYAGQPSQSDLKNHLIIIGFGLNGHNLARVVQEINIPFVIVELNDHLVRQAREEGYAVVFGDAGSKEVLEKAGAHHAQMIVIAISDAAATRRCLVVSRSLNEKAFILVRTRYVAEVESLEELGANIVIPEEFETSVEIFARVLERYRIPEHLIEQQIAVIRSGSYGMLRDLSVTQERLLQISELFLKTTVEQIVIGEGSPAVERSLRELNLRKATGASIIAVLRGDEANVNPDGGFILKPNDVVVIWGAHQQLNDASRVLTKGSTTT